MIASLATTSTDDFNIDFDNDYLDTLDNADPTIAKFMKKSKCQACLLGNHDEKDCFLRGDKFIPDGLRRRLKIYNKVHGDAPPQGHKVRVWNPPLMLPIHSKDKSHTSFIQPDNFGSRCPFSNTKTKTRDHTIKLFNFDDNDISEEEHNEQQIDKMTDPSMSAFISDQVNFEQNMDYTTFDSNQPTICSMNDQFGTNLTSLVENQLEFEANVQPFDPTEVHFHISSARQSDDHEPPIQPTDSSQNHDDVADDQEQQHPTTRQILLHAIRHFLFRPNRPQLNNTGNAQHKTMMM